MAQSSDSKENKNDSKENKNEHSEPQEQATNKPDVEKSPDQKDGKKEGSESPEEDMDIIVDYTDEETVKTLCSQVSDCSESLILCNRWL